MPGIQELVRVETAPGLGRVLVAAKEFKAGDEILREEPLVFWPAGDLNAYLKELCNTDATVRNAVLDMVHPPLDTDVEAVRELRTRAQNILDEGDFPKFCDIDFAHAALLVQKLNGHSFRGRTHIALFERGSKVEHSCNPNCAYSSRDIEGMLLIKAIRPIIEGERLSMSYIGELWLKTHAARRVELLETKWFVCRCTRCVSPDPLRAMPCNQDEKQTMVWVHPEPSADETKPSALDKWISPEANPSYTLTDQQTDWLRLEESAVAHKLQHAVGYALIEESLDEPKAVIEIFDLLPRTNVTAIRAHLLCGQVLRTRAEDAAGHPRESTLRFRAAQEMMEAVNAMEHVAAGSTKRSRCPSDNHPAVYHNAPHALEAARDLFKAGKEHDGSELLAREICKYVPLMLIMWPQMKSDEETLNMLEELKDW